MWRVALANLGMSLAYGALGYTLTGSWSIAAFAGVVGSMHASLLHRLELQRKELDALRARMLTVEMEKASAASIFRLEQNADMTERMLVRMIERVEEKMSA